MATARECIKCGGSLQPKMIETVEVDICPGCGGLWLDRGEIQQLASLSSQLTDRIILRLNSVDPPQGEGTELDDGASYRPTVKEKARSLTDPLNAPCPACHGKLTQATVGVVLIERCTSCEGLFLDKGELEKAMYAMGSSTSETSTIMGIARCVTTRGSIGD